MRTSHPGHGPIAAFPRSGRGAALIEKTLGAVRGSGLIFIFCHWQRPIHDASRTGRLVLQRNTSSFCDCRDGSSFPVPASSPSRQKVPHEADDATQRTDN